MMEAPIERDIAEVGSPLYLSLYLFVAPLSWRHARRYTKDDFRGVDLRSGI